MSHKKDYKAIRAAKAMNKGNNTPKVEAKNNPGKSNLIPLNNKHRDIQICENDNGEDYCISFHFASTGVNQDKKDLILHSSHNPKAVADIMNSSRIVNIAIDVFDVQKLREPASILTHEGISYVVTNAFFKMLMNEAKRNGRGYYQGTTLFIKACLCFIASREEVRTGVVDTVILDRDNLLAIYTLFKASECALNAKLN